MSTLYFNETGPIYRTEHVQAKEFVNLVRNHVVVLANQNPPGKESVRFGWETFRAAVASVPASDLSVEHDLNMSVPLTQTTSGDVPATTLQAVLDALVAHFASTFTTVFFAPPSSGAVKKEEGEAYFFDTLRKNLYHAFTHHRDASESERCLSFYGPTGPGHAARSAWEYRLLFTHSAAGSKTVRGLVMTVTLEGGGGKDAWCDVSLGSRGPFTGALRAMQVIVGEGFRCP